MSDHIDLTLSAVATEGLRLYAEALEISPEDAVAIAVGAIFLMLEDDPVRLAGLDRRGELTA